MPEWTARLVMSPAAGGSRAAPVWLRMIALLLVLLPAVNVRAQTDDLDTEPSPESVAAYAFYAESLPINLSCDALRFARLSDTLYGSTLRVPDDVTISDVDADGVAAGWFTPPDAPDTPVIYYLHGGAYILGAPNGVYRSHLARLAETTGLRVFAAWYRLAPENPFPAGLDDAVTAYHWLLNTGIDANQIIIAGDSAGGGLALATLLSLRDAGDPLPAGAALISPWADLTLTGTTHLTHADLDPILTTDGLDASADCYAGNTDRANPLVSPLYADLTGLPPLLIQVGTYEILLADSTRLARRARRAGVDVTLDVWDGQVHVWPLFSDDLPEGERAFADIAAFARASTVEPGDG